MKRLMIAILISFPVLVNAQSFWNIVEDNYNKSHISDKGLFQDSILLVSGYVSDASCPSLALFVYNINGQKLWNNFSACELIGTDKDFIYTAGIDIGMDDVIGDDHLVLSKFDIEGNEIFSLQYPSLDFYEDYFDFNPTSINITNDGTILVSSNKSIVKSNIDGTKIIEYEITLEKDIEAISSINQLAYLINTQTNIYKSDSSFNLLDSIQFSNSINKLLFKNDTVYTLMDSKIVRLDTSLNIIDTIFSSSTLIQNMEVYDNQLWIQIVQSDSVKMINLQKNESSDTLVFPVLVNNVEFIVSENSFTFVGNSFTNQIGICNFQIANAEIETGLLPDIEIIDFDIENIVIEYYQMQEDSFAMGYRFNTELIIKNNGNVTLNSFAVFSDLHGGMNCAQNYFYQKFSDIEILPGQTQTVNLNSAYEEGIINNQLCFQCLAPNSELEIQTSNNSTCKTFTIIGIENETQTNLRVYPNPITDYLISELPDFGLKSVEIIDINGKVLISKVSSEQRIRIETTNLTKGLYIVKINSGTNINTKLIIKE